MSSAPRPIRTPGLIAGCWALSVVSGAALLAVGPTTEGPEPDALSPYSLAAYLTRVAGPDAQQVRVNGVYGSGHNGAWQFTAHLSWRTPSGLVRGGLTELPQSAGQTAIETDFSRDRLELEQEIGWSMEELDDVLDDLSGVSDRLAMLELQIRPDGRGPVVACHSDFEKGPAQCNDTDRSGRPGPPYEALLTDSTMNGALSVQRTPLADGLPR